MFEFKVSTLEESEGLCKIWATKCISLLDPKMRDFYKSTESRHFEFFDDIETVPLDFSQCIPPTKEHIERILEYSSTFSNSDKVLVHCHAGVSRSTAMLLGIFCQHGVEPYDAVSLLQQAHPRLWPNNLIIQYCDEILQLNDNLIKAVKDFKQDNAESFFYGWEQETK